MDWVPTEVLGSVLAVGWHKERTEQGRHNSVKKSKDGMTTRTVRGDFGLLRTRCQQNSQRKKHIRVTKRTRVNSTNTRLSCAQTKRKVGSWLGNCVWKYGLNTRCDKRKIQSFTNQPGQKNIGNHGGVRSKSRPQTVASRRTKCWLSYQMYQSWTLHNNSRNLCTNVPVGHQNIHGIPLYSK